MSTRKILKRIAIVAIAGLILAGGLGIYMFNMPHRDVSSAKVDYSLTSSELVREYLNDFTAANQKYLSADGDSKILEITGKVSEITEDFNGQKVVLLKNDQDPAGVSATFLPETNAELRNLEPGQTITVKGVIRSGASYDEDLGFHLNAVLDKSSLIK